jgi:GT2 family glycosyltransferase
MRTLSVCIPTYEANPDYLLALLRSIDAAPSDLRVEVIVSDDRSANCADIERLVRTATPDAIMTRSDTRLGMVGNWNRAAALARGEWLVLPGQDDLLDLAAISALIERAETAAADLAFGAEAYISAAGVPRSDPRRGPTVDRVWGDDERRQGVLVDARICLLVGGVLGDPCAAVISTAAFRSRDGFSAAYGHSADTELWARISATGGRVLLTDLPTSTRRIHDENATAGHVRSGVAAADRASLVRDYGDAMTPPLLAQAAGRLALHSTFDLLRARGRRGRRVQPGHRVTPVGLVRAIGVDLKLSPALRATRRRFEAAT